jgi:hypothetical protein
MGDPEIEGAQQDLTRRLQRTLLPEVMPEAQRDGRKQEPAAPAPAVGNTLITVRGGAVAHDGQGIHRELLAT